MNDCSNAEIRDLLPDLLHDHLDASSRTMVLAHVAECVDCRDELELLRSLQKTLNARTPRVDIAYVVNALPKPPARRPQTRSIPLSRRRWSDWRIAAGVTVLIAGGSSLALLRRAPESANLRPPVTDSSANRAIAPAGGGGAATQAPANPTTPSPVATVAQNDDADTAEEGQDGRFGGLSDVQMQTLLNELDGLKAVPVTEPEPVTIRVDVKPGGPEGLR